MTDMVPALRKSREMQKELMLVGLVKAKFGPARFSPRP